VYAENTWNAGKSENLGEFEAKVENTSVVNQELRGVL
jgi:hypothetical protein